MTKEELKREAEEKAKELCKFPINWNELDVAKESGFIKGYLAGSEPREKRIAELTEQNTSLQHKVDTLQGFLDRDVEFDNLQKENAELKARLNAINLLTPELEKKSKLRRQQLTKAIGIIKRWYETNSSACIEPSQELIEVTEQFLNSEVEK